MQGVEREKYGDVISEKMQEAQKHSEWDKHQTLLRTGIPLVDWSFQLGINSHEMLNLLEYQAAFLKDTKVSDLCVNISANSGLQSAVDKNMYVSFF